MTVLASKTALNLRRELAKGAAAYSEQKFYFDGLVTNGTFDTTAGWTGISETTDARWYIDSGRLTKGGTNGVASQIANPLISGNSYRVYIDVIDKPLDSVVIMLGDASYYITGTLGTQSVLLSPTDISDGIQIRTGGAGGGGVILDNFAVFNVDANDDVIHAMPKGWKPKDVFEDGLLQREGSLHDYEVVFDGFDYVVKPTVAPTATTETAVIGVKA
jgi:hypothetical protein